MQNEFSFNLYNTLAPSGICLALKKMYTAACIPSIVCIGSDLSVGDSLGPVTGTKLKERLRGLNCFIYGTLSSPVTAHEVKYINSFVHSTHPESPVIAIDAAVGSAGDIGLIKIAKRGVKPGAGANKKLARVGDGSIIGIIAEKSIFNFSILTATRLNIVYRMADIIAEGVADFVLDNMRRIACGENIPPHNTGNASNNLKAAE